ncbi:MAG: indolepyruvate ferredoxin oxidoreductase subunit alpha [Desulfobacteraceae bacterium]|jgi:indolepyruvate ferredoxin oxidoreductase alpha subunit
MKRIDVDEPGSVRLLMGNEAIARGALEAGIGVATAYPGTPSSEVIATLANAAKKQGLYVEWSANEKVAVEVAAAAALSGVRSITAMKQNGLNVALDFLANLAITGINKGMVLMVGDDPGGQSSTNEQDSRYIAKILDLPLLEPATFQDAKDMTKWAFELSESISNVCIVRSVTRISHARGNVVLGELPAVENRAHFDTSKSYAGIGGVAPNLHRVLHENHGKVTAAFDGSPFNSYLGPENPDLLIAASGSGWLYASEAVRNLALDNSVGVLKVGTTWPLPVQFLRTHLPKSERILVVEEVDAFLEANLKEFVVDDLPGQSYRFFGKASGHIHPYGELNVDLVIGALTRILSMDYRPRDAAYEKKSLEIAETCVPPRTSQLCPGCPHRATYWALKDALKMDGRHGVVLGDIGCYAMGLFPTGFSQVKTVHAMGSGMGVASGLGKLDTFGFDQPVVAVSGDSTFYHSVIPALLNAVHSEADVVLVVMDNAGTAMTGFQPHPGSDVDAEGDTRPAISIEKLCESIGVTVTVVDPYDIEATREAFLDVLADKGKTRVVISRRECALIGAKKKGGPVSRIWVEPDKCLGDSCGCNRYCTRVFKCPGLMWDKESGKARIDEAVCNGCGVCVSVCPQSAIVAEAVS